MATQTSRFAGKAWWQMPIFADHPVARVTADGPVKGEYNSLCQRHACDNSGARWFNHTNARYYCSTCARTFNEVLRRQGRGALCELHLSR